MKKVTFADVARQAGVGTATAERVINGRGGVSERTAEKVVRAAKKLGYGNRHVLLHRGAIRIEVILVRPDTSYFSRLNHAFGRASASLDRSIVVHRTFVEESDPTAIARHIAHPPFRRSGLIICARDDKMIKDSLMKVRSDGVEIIQIITRCDNGSLPYLGIDNYAAGRTVAYHMSGMLSGQRGTFVALCHSGSYMNHRDRIRGFSDFLGSTSSEHTFSHVILTQDDDLLTTELLRETLQRDSEIIGIYSAGGGDDGVAKILRELLQVRRIFWVSHDLTARKKEYFQSGLLDLCLDEPPEVLARRALTLVLCRLGVLPPEPNSDPIRFGTVTPENG